MTAPLPRVSAIVLTYQFEEFIERSIESVLAQDYPAELLEVIVVDDGSSDATPELLAPYLDRVRYIRKRNGGLISSVNRGLQEAGGELIALQSGDDEWTPGRLARQVALLGERPEAGLVYGDMEVVDRDGNTLSPSFWARERITPHRGRALGPLVRSNFVSGGTMLVRASLRERFHPLPELACWEDWWIAVRVAEVAELDYISEPLLRYRFHGANMSLGADPERQLAKAAQEVGFRRWLLTDLPLETVSGEDLIVACRLYEHCVLAAAAAAEQRGEQAAAVSPAAPGAAERIGELARAGHEAIARGQAAEAMRLAARALGADLHDARSRDLFAAASAALEGAAAPGRPSTGPAARSDPAPAGAAPARRAGGAPLAVTLGIATFDRDAYLAEAIASALEQEYADLEVLVVDDGSRNPAVAEVLAGFGDPRLRVVRHEENRGIAAAYNTIVEHARGELIAMLGDDDVCLPGRIAREAQIFERHPDTGVVHGDALVIDSEGRMSGRWESRDFAPAELLQSFIRDHNRLIDPTRMVHRRVYDALGGYDVRYRIAQDLHFWLRAARRFRFRHCPGGPVIALRRHGANTSGEEALVLEVADVSRALEELIEQAPLRELVPDLDWAVLEPLHAERRALELLAARLRSRALPLPELAGRVSDRARSLPEPPALRAPLRSGATASAGARASSASRDGAPSRLMITSFGFNDAGGGTTVPRLLAKELARRGWEVSVFCAATAPSGSGKPYEVIESEEDGVRLLSLHNRQHGLWDLGHPLRELDDPPITAAFARALDRLRPEVVHFHNLHNLGAALMDEAAARGLPAYFTTHNYWLLCPRAYLLTGAGEICAGPGDGSRCASCVRSPEQGAHRLRLHSIRARAGASLARILAVSDAVRATLLGAGYAPETIDVVRQGMPHVDELWEALGADRVRIAAEGRRVAPQPPGPQPGAGARPLAVAFLGSAYPHKGPQLLVQAAQLTESEVRVEIHGEVPGTFAQALQELDGRGCVELCGRYEPSELRRVLAGLDAAVLPSMWWDCAPLAAAECLAAGLPVIAPRLGGLAEAVRDGVDGLLFDPLDARSLAGCLDRLAREQGLLERLRGGIERPRPFSEYVDELESYYRCERASGTGVSGCAAPAAVGRQAPAPAVRWQGDHGLPTSLAIVNDRVTERLARALPLQRVARDGRALDAPLAHVAEVEVRHQWPPDLSPAHAGRLALIQPWEFGALPREWLQPLHGEVAELWVPSEFVRAMYVGAGIEPGRVAVVPNGVDLDLFTPEGDRRELAGSALLRLLYVGGLIWRKGPDVLLDAYTRAFAGRADVELVMKDFGANGVYREGEREEVLAHAASGALPRVTVIDEDLAPREIAALYRACDALVAPYRAEGFAMPVLEAMACGLPVIVTAGGPTDEFCPDEACLRIRSRPVELAHERVGPLATAGRPRVLEPDAGHLAELLLEIAGDEQGRAARGAAGRRAAQRLGWDAVAALYRERIEALAASPRAEPGAEGSWEFEEQAAVRVLATPAWRGADRLAELLAAWRDATRPGTGACLYLLAEPRVAGAEQELEARVLACGVDLEGAADVTVLLHSIDEGRLPALHRAVDAYVPLHAGCSGHERTARAAGTPVIEPCAEALGALLGRAAAALQPA